MLIKYPIYHITPVPYIPYVHVPCIYPIYMYTIYPIYPIYMYLYTLYTHIHGPMVHWVMRLLIRGWEVSLSTAIETESRHITREGLV